MRDPRRNPVPARYRYPRKAEREAGGSRRRWAVTGAGVAALAVVVAVGALLMLRDGSPPIDEGERAAVVAFTEDILDVEGMRESVLVEFGQVGIDIRTTEFSVVFRTLQSVIAKQEQLAGEMRSIDSPSNVTALAHTLFIDSYERELEGYELLNRVAGQAQNEYTRTARRDVFDASTVTITRPRRFERRIGHANGHTRSCKSYWTGWE